jgi:hypothetical protein
MSKTLAVILAALSLLAAATASAAPVNLSSWQALTLNYAGGQGSGDWALEPGNTAVTQTLNADPSFFRNNVVQGGYKIQGTWQVNQTGGDDDYIGFAFGYQNSSNFYLFDWKQSSQSFNGRIAAEGMTIKRFTGATGNGSTDLSLEEFWENQVSFGDMTVLATNHASTAGWVDTIPYTFLLDFNTSPGQFNVVVKQGAAVLWDHTVLDSTFTNGQFAFFNNSQQAVRYAGFEQDVIPGTGQVPEPATWILVCAALVGLTVTRRRRIW